MILLGLDPGISGAAAAIDHNGDIVGIRDFPTIELPGNGSIRRRLHGAGLVRVIRELVPADEKAIAYIEDVQAWGGIAASQIAAMIGAKTALLTVLDLFSSHVSIEPVQPSVWKSHFALRRTKEETIAAFKARSIAKAAELFPDAGLHRARDDGRAEALLIAAYGRHHQGFREDLLAPPKCKADLQQAVFG